MLMQNGVAERDKWKFTYKGSDLAKNAIQLRNHYQAEEVRARNEMARLTSDKSISIDSKEAIAARENVQRSASLAEQFSVYAHEFTRTPDREFILGMADVTFFELIPPNE
jgi:hypothetical protein